MKNVTIHKVNSVKNIGITILIVFLILAVIVGFVAATPNQEYLDHLAKYADSYYPREFRGAKTVFNFVLFFATAIAGVFASALFFVIGAIIDRQNATIGLLIEIHNTLFKDTDNVISTDPPKDPSSDYLNDSSF